MKIQKKLTAVEKIRKGKNHDTPGKLQGEKPGLNGKIFKPLLPTIPHLLK